MRWTFLKEYLNDLSQAGLTKAMYNEISIDVENVIQSIKNQHEGW